MKRQFLLTLILVSLASLPLVAMDHPGSNIPTLTAQQSKMLQYLKQYEQQLLTAKSEGEIQVYLKAIQDTGASQESDCPFFTQYIWHFMQKVFVSGLSDQNKHTIITGLACFLPPTDPCRPSLETTIQFLNNKINPCSLSTHIDDPLTNFIAEAIQTNNLSHLQELLKYADDPTHKAQLQSACQTIQEQSLQAPVSLTTAANSAASATPQQITLQTHDGNEHKVTEVIINQCETLEEMVEECGDTLPLPRHITTKIITNLIPLLYLCHTLVNNPEDLKQKIQESLKKHSIEDLIALLETVNYVQGPQIVFDMLIEHIATCIFNKDNLVTNLLNPTFCSALRQIDSNRDLTKLLLKYKDMYSCLLESCRCTISAQDLSPESYSWSPDGSCIAVKSYDSTRKTYTLTLITKDGITKELCSMTNISDYSWSPDSSCITIKSGDYPNCTLTLFTKDGTQLCSIPNISNYSWSPDSSCIAVKSYNTETQTYTLILIAKDGTKKELCSMRNMGKYSWSPDGSCIAIKSGDYPNYTLTLVTKEGTKLCSFPTEIFNFSWSPDGSSIAIPSKDSITNTHTLTLVTKEGTKLCSISTISGFSWSPDGSCIAIRSGNYPNYTLTLVTKDDTQQKPLCSLTSDREFPDLDWSPDSSCIAVQSGDCLKNTFTFVTKEGKLLGSTIPDTINFSWSADNSCITVQSYDHKTHLYTLTLVTKYGTQKQLCSFPNIIHSYWNPDGSCIAILSGNNPNYTLTLVTKNGTTLCSISTISGFSWSPDSSCIAIATTHKLMICKKEIIVSLSKINLSQALLLQLFNHCIKNNQTDCLAQLPPVLVKSFHDLPEEIKKALPESIKKRIILHMPRLLSRWGILCLGYFKKP